MTKTPLAAVRAWQAPTDYATGGLPIPESEWAAAARDSLESAVADVQARHLYVPIEQRLVKGNPVRVLLHQAANAGLLVVGSRGRGGFKGALPSSVSWRSVHHLPCPVLVFRHGPQAT